MRSKEDGKVYAVKIARDKYKGPSDRKRKLDEVVTLLDMSHCLYCFNSAPLL